MFSRLKKSLQGSSDTLQTRETKNRTFHDVRDLLEDFEQKSMISTCQSEILERGRKRKKERKSRLRSIFRPNEEETSSLVSADPWMNNRSVSLQVLTENNGKMPICYQRGREFNNVEASMQNIQKSLSISALPQTYLNERSKGLVKPKIGIKKLQQKENEVLKPPLLTNLDKKNQEWVGCFQKFK